MSNARPEVPGEEEREIHYLPAPQDVDSSGAIKVNIGSDYTVKFDTLGPMVVNTDGTLSRIANWHRMTDEEKERTMRAVSARNQIRLGRQREAEGATEENAGH
ncbi:unnamed protein product [Somion occarium]|uniref:Uncharacterized protein n=1 Tax=Somion occarium TaxID=3059160 RepID=A0ABP1CLE6_9APHY